MHLIPETSDPTFAEHQIASEISSASAYGPYSEKDQAECVLTSLFVWFSYWVSRTHLSFCLALLGRVCMLN